MTPASDPPRLIDWLVLAGGSSRRMGEDKAQVRVGGATLLHHAVSAARSAGQASHVLILGPEIGGGPAAALAHGVEQVHAEFVGVLAVDTPFVGPALEILVQHVFGCQDSRIDGWVAADSSGRPQWLCSAFRMSSLKTVLTDREWIGVPLSSVAKSLTIQFVPFSADTALMDLDTQEDLAQARAIAAQEARKTTVASGDPTLWSKE